MTTHEIKLAEHRLSDGSFVYDVLIVGPLEEGKRTAMQFPATDKAAADAMAEALTNAINDFSLDTALAE